ncbi:MAG: hypothetical protein RJA07_2781 [Bacteroidota bacterium]|jgi:hypothetical protein
MKQIINFILIGIFFFGCERNSSKNKNIRIDTIRISTSKKEQFKSRNNSIKNDSLELTNFWNKAIMPITTDDSSFVVAHVRFPLAGEWMKMIKANSNVKNEEQKIFFKEHYHFLFNKEVRKILSAKQFKDVDISNENGYVFYSVFVGKKTNGFESGIILKFAKSGSDYFLISFLGTGGNFY